MANNTGIRINEITVDTDLDGTTDLVHVYKLVGDSYQSVSTPLCAVAFQGPKGDKGKDGVGVDGRSVAQLTCYRRFDPGTSDQDIKEYYQPGKANLEGDINDDGSFDFGSMEFTPPAGWYKGVPVINAGQENWILYSCTGVAQTNTPGSGLDDNIIWSEPESAGKSMQPGVDGVNGKSTYQAVIFTRSATAPEAPFGGAFNFGTDELLPPLSSADNGSVQNPGHPDGNGNTIYNTHNWYVDVGGNLGPPESALQLWMCNQQFSTEGDTASAQGGDWSTPTRFARDGADGYSTYYGNIYKRDNATSQSQPGFLNGGRGKDNVDDNGLPDSGYYDFRKNKFIFQLENDNGPYGRDLTDQEGPMAGWSEDIPDESSSTRTTLWVSRALATSNASFLGSEPVQDTTLDWSSPIKIQTPSIDGNQGALVAQVRAFTRTVDINGPGIAALTGSQTEFSFENKILDLKESGWSTAPYSTTLEPDDINYGYDKLWVSVGVAASTPVKQNDGSFIYPNDANINWADPVPASEDGEAARSTYLAQIYTRTTSAIETGTYAPTGGSFNFSTQTLTVPESGQAGLTWSANIPSGFEPIYVSQRNFSVLGNQGIDVSQNPWSIPALLAYNGAAGASGISSIILTLYYGSDAELTGDDIPDFPDNVNLVVNLSPTAGSNTFGRIIRSETNGVSASVTNNRIDGTDWYTQLPDKKWIYATQAVAADSDASDEDYHDTIAGDEWSDTVVFRRPGDHGLTGLGTATVHLYKRTSSSNSPTPNKPDGDITYYLGTENGTPRGSIVLGNTSLQGWSTTPVDFDGSNHYLWQITAVASSRENTDTIPSTEWSAPVLFSQNPFDLTETTVSHIVEAYKRSSDSPQDNPGSCTVNLSGELAGQIQTATPLANNWSTTIPDGDQQLYIVHATASGPVSDINDTDTINANEWSAPAKWGIVGPVGPRGIPGSIPRAITLYKYTDLTPTQTEIDTPTLSATYDFTTDTVTFGTPYTGANQNAWTYNVPLSDVTDKILWQTSATAFSSVESSQYTLLSSSWNAPIAIGRSGTSIRFLGSYDTYNEFQTNNDPLSAGYAFYHTGQKESYIVTGFDESNGNAIYQVFAKDQQGTPGVGITYKGEYANSGTVGDHNDLSAPELNWVYRDTTLSASYIYTDTNEWVLFNKDGEPGRSVTGISNYSLTSDGTATEVTLSFSSGTPSETFAIQNGTDAQPLSVVSGSFNRTNGLDGNFEVKLGDNKGNEYPLEVPVSDGDGINFIDHVDHTVNGVTLGKKIQIWKDSNPYDASNHTNPDIVIGPILNGSDGAAANVAIVYAIDVDGLSASYDKTYDDSGVDRIREFVKYFEYNPADYVNDTDGKPNISRFEANNGALSGGFVQWRGDPGQDGTSGSSIVPIYASVRHPQIGTDEHNLSYVQSTGSEQTNNLIERQFVTFYEKQAGFTMPELTNASYQNFISSQTFVNLKGIRGTSIKQVSRDDDGTVRVLFDDETENTFTVTDGKDATFVSATRDTATQEVELTFNTGGSDVKKRFNLNDGTSISSISSREDENGNTTIVVMGKIDGTGAEQSEIGRFTVNKGPQGIASKVVVVYATDTDGSDARFDRTSGTDHVKYHEYTGNQPDINQFKANNGPLSGGFVQFVGDPGSSVVPIFAEDSSGSNPSLTQTAAKTFITFYEKPYGTIVDGSTSLAALTALISNNNLTFVNIQTPAAGAGLLAYPAFGTDDFEDIKFDADENALVLEDDGSGTAADTSIGMAYPAINVEDAGVVEFDVTFRSDINDTDGVYVRVYETRDDLQSGKLAISVSRGDQDSPISIIQTEGVINNGSGSYGTFPAGNTGPRGFVTKQNNSGENIGVTTSYVTSSFRYIPHPDAKWASLNILNWGGMGDNKLFVKPIIPRILGKNIETVTKVSGSETMTFTFNDGTSTNVTVPNGNDVTVTDVSRETDKSNQDYGKVTMTFQVGSDASNTFTRTFDTQGIGIGDVTATQVTDTNGNSVTRISVVDDNNNVINTVDVPNGLPGANSHVAIVYADNANGLNASYDSAGKTFIRYHEFTGDPVNDKPAAETFGGNGINQDDDSFVKYVGVDGKSVTPIYSSVADPSSIGDLSLTPDSNTKFVTFYEKLGGVSNLSNLTTTEQNALLNASTTTFVRYVGADGTSVSILGSKDSTNNLPSAASSTLGDGYIIGNDLYIYTGNDDNTDNGYENVGVIRGPQGIPGTAVTPIYATNSTGAGKTLEQTDSTTHVFFYLGETLTSANSATKFSAINPAPTFRSFEGPVGFDSISITPDAAGTSGRTKSYNITFSRGNGTVGSDTFTVQDGTSITSVSAVNRNNDTGETTITFKNDAGDKITTPAFTINDGDGIDHIAETPLYVNGVSGKRIDIYVDSSPHPNGTPKSTFTILNGDPINLVTVYAEDAAGTNASYTRGTHEFVKYHEYTNSDGKPPIDDFKTGGNLAGGFIKFVGEDAEPITPIYATSASGANASLTEGVTATHINFYEGAISSISNNGVVTTPNGYSFNVSGLTFIKIKGETGATGNAGIFFNGFEPGDEFNAWTAQNSSTKGRHTIAASTDKYAGTQAALIKTSNKDTDASGEVGGVYAVVPENLALLFAGKQIEVTIYAKKPSTSAASSFQAAYSTNDVGNSGWQTFSDLTTDWKPFRFTYNVPSPNNGGTDYIGIQGGKSDGNGVLIDNVSIAIKAIGISGVAPKDANRDEYVITYDDGRTDSLTLSSGRDVNITGITHNGGESYTINFRRGDTDDPRYDGNVDDFSLNTTIPRGDGINAIIESPASGNDKNINFYLDSDPYYDANGDPKAQPPNPFQTITMLGGQDGAAANILIVFADDAHGANASTTATKIDGTRRRYVRYHEYTGTAPGVSTFEGTGVNQVDGSFVEYIGADGKTGDPITPIYATDANGADASLSATSGGVTRTFTNFFEGKVTSIDANGTITKEDNSTVQASTLTFVNTKGQRGQTGKTGASVTQVSRVNDKIEFTIKDADGNQVGSKQKIDIYDGSNSEITNISRAADGRLKFEWKNPSTDVNGVTTYDDLTSYAPLEDGVSVTGFVTTDVGANGEDAAGDDVVGTRVQWLTGGGTSTANYFGAPFTIARGLPGPQAGVKVIYASDSKGNNPSYTISDGNYTGREYVAYYEYTENNEPANATAAASAHTGGGGTFAKFIGKDGDNANITTVYATDSSGSNASLSNQDFNGSPRTYVTFIEQALADDNEVATYLGENSTTFVQLKGDPSPIYIAYHNNDINNKPSALTGGAEPSGSNGWYYHNESSAATDSENANWRIEKSGADGPWGVVTKIRGDKGVTGATGATGRPNGCEAVYDYGTSSSGIVTYDETENALLLKSDTDSTIGMVYPAINVVSAPFNPPTIQFTITYKSDGGSSNSGFYARIYETDQELAPGKTAIGLHDSSINAGSHTSIQAATKGALVGETGNNESSSVLLNGNGRVDFYPGDGNNNGEDDEVPSDWKTLTLYYIPEPGYSKYISLTILNWSGHGTKGIYVKPVIPTIEGVKGSDGSHGISEHIVEIFKRVPLNASAPSAPSHAFGYNWDENILVYYNDSDWNSPDDSDGWSLTPPDAESGYKIYRTTALLQKSAGYNIATPLITINPNSWTSVRAWGVGNIRTSPVVSRIATYNYFSSNHGNITVNSNNEGYYSFRKKTVDTSNYNSGWGSTVTTSTDPITAIGQILFTLNGKDSVDHSNFWAELDTAAELLWKYGASWILFRRDKLVDDAENYNSVDVTVLDHSEDIQEIKDLPGFYNTPSEAEVVFGYTPLVKSETIYLYQRTNSNSLPSKPGDITHNFNTRSTDGGLGSWGTSMVGSNGTDRYLWITQATAVAKLDPDTGQYIDTILAGEWSKPTILAQDGQEGAIGGSYFQKLLYTRTNISTPDFIGDWVNSDYRPETLGVAVKASSSYNIGDITGRGSETTRVTWSEDIPPESDGQYIWVIIAPVTTNGNVNFVAVNRNQWSEPVMLAKDGKGLNSSTVRLYKRTTGQSPAGSNPKNVLGFSHNTGTPSFTYTFDTGNLDTKQVNLNGWSTNIPNTGGNVLWVSRAVASSAGTNDEISWDQWSDPERLVSDGAALVFIGDFANRGAYKKHIEDNHGGIPPVNSYHIENTVPTLDDRAASYLYVGPQDDQGINSVDNFKQLTVDGVRGQTGQKIVFRGTATTNNQGKPNVIGAENGDVYKITDANGKGQLWILEKTVGDGTGDGWELLTVDGSDGIGGTPGNDGNSVFICYNTKEPNPGSPPNKPGNSSDGTTGSGDDQWYTSTTNGKKYNWMCQKVAKTATDSNVAWSDPILIGGEPGEAGQRTFNIKIYHRAASKPGIPTGGSYDFVNDKLLVPDGWSSSIKNAGCDPEKDAEGNLITPPTDDPREVQGYEWTLPNSGSTTNSKTWVITGKYNLNKISGTDKLPLFSSEATVTATVGNVVQYDDSINWSPVQLEEINGVDLVDDSVDADRVYGVVKNGGGVAKIVATDRNNAPLTQEAYDSLADPNRGDNGFGWEPTDGIDDNTLYIIL